jgi:hypothetical protein
MACGMFDEARQIILSKIDSQEPGLPESERRVRLFLRPYGRVLAPGFAEAVVERIRCG